MKTKKPRNLSQHDILDDSPTDEVLGLSEEYLARHMQEIAAGPAAEPGTGDATDTDILPALTKAGDASAPSVKKGARLLSLERVEAEIHQLMSQWSDIEDDLKERAVEIERLNGVLASKQNEINALEREVSARAGERDQARTESGRLQTELREQQAAIAEAQRQSRTLSDEITELRLQMRRLEQDVAARKSVTTELDKQIGLYRDALLGMEQTVADNERAFARHEGEKVALATTIVGLEQQCAVLNGRREESEAANIKLQSLLADGHRELERLSGELGREHDVRERLVNELSAQEGLSGRLRTEVSALHEQITMVREQFRAAQEAIETERQQLERATALQVGELNASLQQEQANIGRLSEEVAQRDRRISDLQNALVAECESAEAARRRATESEGKITAVLTDLAERDQRLRELEVFSLGHAEALAANRNELLAATKKCDGLDKALHDKERQIATLHATIEEVKEGRTQLEGALAAQRATMAELEVELRSKRQTIAGLDSEVRRLDDIESHVQHLGNAMSHQLFSTNRGSGRTTRLLVTVTGEHAVKYPLYKDVMVIGRSTDSDIQVQGQYTSRHHARICSDNDGSFVEDLDSKNGVRVNEQSIRRQRLHDGDMVDVGGAKLRFIDLATRKAASAA